MGNNNEHGNQNLKTNGSITEQDIAFLKNNKRWDSTSIDLLRRAIKSGMIKMKELRYPPFEDDFMFFKRPNVVYTYTDKELADLYLASKSVLYFAENFVYIESRAGIEKIKLWDYQREMLKALATKKGVIIKASRQVGKCIVPYGFVVVNSTRYNAMDLFCRVIIDNMNNITTNKIIRFITSMLLRTRNKILNLLYRVV